MEQDIAFFSGLLNLLIFLPALAIPLVLLAGQQFAKYIAFGASVITLGIAVYLLSGYLDYSAIVLATDGQVFGASIDWFTDRYDIKFMTAVDGISIYLLLLNALVFPIALLYSTKTVRTRQPLFYALMLLLQTGIFGVFASVDLIVFYVFFELVLLPSYFLLGLWGGKERGAASIKFFVYTMMGSLAMLIGIIWLGFHAGPQVDAIFTSDLYKLMSDAVVITPAQQMWLFFAFGLSFAIKTPLVPLHTWQPQTYAQSSTAVTVVFAALMSKLGVYGMVRFMLPLFPEASYDLAGLMAVLGMLGIIYGAIVAASQKNIKRLIAYSSIAHMGFVVMGIFAFDAMALSGSVYQMVSHGVATAAMFLLVGMLGDRSGTYAIADYRGIAKQLPVFTFLIIFVSMASVGLPGLNGFVGEFLILTGSFASKAFSMTLVVIATIGVILAAVYLLWMLRRVLFGELDSSHNKQLKDLMGVELTLLLPLLVLIVVMGVYATPLLAEIERSVNLILEIAPKAGGMATLP